MRLFLSVFAIVTAVFTSQLLDQAIAEAQAPKRDFRLEALVANAVPLHRAALEARPPVVDTRALGEKMGFHEIAAEAQLQGHIAQTLRNVLAALPKRDRDLLRGYCQAETEAVLELVGKASDAGIRKHAARIGHKFPAVEEALFRAASKVASAKRVPFVPGENADSLAAYGRGIVLRSGGLRLRVELRAAQSRLRVVALESELPPAEATLEDVGAVRMADL